MPFYEVPTGRRDGRVSDISFAANLPDVDDSIRLLKSKFRQKGLSHKDLVLLSSGIYIYICTLILLLPMFYPKVFLHYYIMLLVRYDVEKFPIPIDFKWIDNSRSDTLSINYVIMIKSITFSAFSWFCSQNYHMYCHCRCTHHWDNCVLLSAEAIVRLHHGQ